MTFGCRSVQINLIIHLRGGVKSFAESDLIFRDFDQNFNTYYKRDLVF